MASTTKKVNTRSKQDQNSDPEAKIENALGNTEKFFEKYTKQMLYGLLAVVVIVGGFFAYRYLVAVPKEGKAADAMYVAEQIFAQGDYSAALEGDGVNAGFREVVEDFGGTRSGRLAAHYAGICCMKLGDLDGAMEYLTKYKSVKGAPGAIINAQNLGLQGDVMVARGDYAKAAELYRRAAGEADNILTTPYYLRKLAMTYVELGRNEEAVAACRRIKTEYSQSLEARDIDKYIGEIEMR